MAGSSEQDGAASGQSPGATAPTDDDLLARMSCQEDLDGARAAGAEFYQRHVEYLYSVCLRAHRRFLGEDGVSDLVADTFRRVFESGARGFKPSGLDDPEEMRRRVRGWLGRIANNLVRDILRGRRGGTEVGLESSAWQNVPERTQEPPSEATAEVCRLMESLLSEREQDVIRTTFLWNDPDEIHQKLPDEVLTSLAARWGMTADNVRQVRTRAMKKLRTALGQAMANSVTGRKADV